MRLRLATGLLVIGIVLRVWPEDADSGKASRELLGGYTTLGVEADLLEGNLDGTIKRMEGHVHIMLYSDDPELEPLPIRADEVAFSYAEDDKSMPELILLKGHAVIEHPEALMKADRAEWDFATGEVVLTGNPTIDTATMTGVRAEKIRINLEEGTWNMTKGRAERIDLAASRSQREPSTDPSLLREGDLKDWPGFLAAFKKQCMGLKPSPGRHILALFDPEAETLIASMTAEELLELKEDFVKRMNEALVMPKFYDEAAWQGISMPNEAAELLQARTERALRPNELTRLNRLLLEAAYPGQIQPRARPASGSAK